MIDRFGDQPKIVWQTNLPKLPLYVSVGSVYRAVISPPAPAPAPSDQQQQQHLQLVKSGKHLY